MYFGNTWSDKDTVKFRIQNIPRGLYFSKALFEGAFFKGNFQVPAPRGAYIRRGDLTEGFLRYEFGGLIFGGAYTWRGLFSEFYGICRKRTSSNLS